MVVSNFSESISQTTTFWNLVLGLLEVRVILRGKLGFYGRIKVSEKWGTTILNESRAIQYFKE